MSLEIKLCAERRVGRPDTTRRRYLYWMSNCSMDQPEFANFQGPERESVLQ
jgi:hypothetical protein